jgi:hypothetical protein
VDHPCPHRDSVLLCHVTAQPDLVQGAEGADGHGQVDAFAGNVFKSSNVFKKIDAIKYLNNKRGMSGFRYLTNEIKLRKKSWQISGLWMTFSAFLERNFIF